MTTNEAEFLFIYLFFFFYQLPIHTSTDDFIGCLSFSQCVETFFVLEMLPF